MLFVLIHMLFMVTWVFFCSYLNVVWPNMVHFMLLLVVWCCLWYGLCYCLWHNLWWPLWHCLSVIHSNYHHCFPFSFCLWYSSWCFPPFMVLVLAPFFLCASCGCGWGCCTMVLLWLANWQPCISKRYGL